MKYIHREETQNIFNRTGHSEHVECHDEVKGYFGYMIEIRKVSGTWALVEKNPPHNVLLEGNSIEEIKEKIEKDVDFL